MHLHLNKQQVLVMKPIRSNVEKRVYVCAARGLNMMHMDWRMWRISSFSEWQFSGELMVAQTVASEY